MKKNGLMFLVGSVFALATIGMNIPAVAKSAGSGKGGSEHSADIHWHGQIPEAGEATHQNDEKQADQQEKAQ